MSKWCRCCQQWCTYRRIEEAAADRVQIETPGVERDPLLGFPDSEDGQVRAASESRAGRSERNRGG